MPNQKWSADFVDECCVLKERPGKRRHAARHEIGEIGLVRVVEVAPDDMRIVEPPAAQLGDARCHVHEDEQRLKEANVSPRDVGER